jgi:serine/threonine-protein kinase
MPDQPPAPPAANPLAPENLEAVVSPALGKRPVDPYLTAQAMPDDLRWVQEDEPVVTSNPFAEEAARVMASAAVAAGPAPGAQVRRPATDLSAPIIESDEHPGRPRSTWPWLLVIVLLLALVGTAYVMLTNRNSGGPQLATVPGIVGLSEAEAMAKVQAAGFSYAKEGVQLSADVAQGVVVHQDPQERGKLEKGKTIGYWVSSGTGLIAVPNVVGMSQEKAAAELSAAGLDVATNSEVSAAQPVGTVLRQNPDATRQVDAGTTVTITVATATNTVTVPLLSGMSKDAALTALSSMHLTATVQAVASGLPGGTVVGQDPAAGTGVQPGTSVTVEVSNAPAPTTVMVPAVGAIGFTQAQAKAELARYGLRARVINEENPNFRPGLCIYQQPAAGVQVKIGSTVSITIARVPTTTTTVSPPAT